jgi:hypothetical protein
LLPRFLSQFTSPNPITIVLRDLIKLLFILSDRIE